jgi:hypothetical protein
VAVSGKHAVGSEGATGFDLAVPDAEIDAMLANGEERE